MWANSQSLNNQSDDGLGRGGQQGVHPFLLFKSSQNQQYVGMYFRNANAQLPIIRNAETDTS
jgi:hypothetical protein